MSLRGFLERGQPIALEEIFAFYDSLPAVPEASMLGEWTGGAVPTGHPGEALLTGMKWVGKRFHDRDRVDPLICEGEHGKRHASNVMGGASLREIAYRGVMTATMIYDKHAIFDHFKKVDDETVLGVMDRKGEPKPLVFWLKRA